MSKDIEAGIESEERIPLVQIVGGDKHSNKDEDEGASCSEGTSPCFKNMGKEDDNKRQEIISGVAMKDKIELCEQRGGETSKFVKMKTKSSEEEIAKDAEKFVEIAEFHWFEFLIFVDNAEKITDSSVEVLRGIFEGQSKYLMFLTSGLGQKIELQKVMDRCLIIETVRVISTFDVIGTGVTDSDHNKQYFGVVDYQKQKRMGQSSERYDKIKAALLLEDASPDDVMKYQLAILKAYSEIEAFCVKMITDGSKELLNAMADKSYFADRRGVLISKNGGLLSSVLYSFVEAFRNGSEILKAEEDMKLVCQDFFSANDCTDVVELVIENIKQNIGKFFAFDEADKINDKNIVSAVFQAIVEGLDVQINFLMDSSKEIHDALSNPEYFKNNNKTLIFKKCGGIPYQIAGYMENDKRGGNISNLNKTNDFVRNIDQNISKLKVYDVNNPESNRMLSRVTTFMERVQYHPILDTTSVLQNFSFLAIPAVLSRDRPEIFKNWSCHQIAIDTYIFCNLRFHWHDKDTRGESKVAKHFGIVNENERRQPEWLHMGTAINKAIEKLSNGIIAKCFHEDGKPNVGIISPIQALIINRVFCMQLDFVKMLWKYDKENVLVNAVMIWILINGILKEKIFARENATDDLTKAKEYFAAAINCPLDKLLSDMGVLMPILKHGIVQFRGKPLYLAAGDGKFSQFLTHTVTKRCISVEWNNPKMGHDRVHLYDENVCCKKLPNFINKPRIKLYIHMIMYAVSYLLLAYYTLQQKAKASGVIKWVVLTMISSLFVDEMRQALGEREYPILISLRRWWSDGWNKMDFLSMMLYYIAFFLECAGVINASRLLFSTFTFIWCLKFYQFLRAFESLGAYIILVQKMLPQLGNFAIVAVIAIISYGVFMTSILFPNISFISWSVFIMVLLRPYLLLFAETGINEYDLSTKNTIYNTPKIETASEIMIVVGMCVFLMFGGVLLLNLLIAIFSGIYEEVKEESMKLWALNDLQLLQEFQRKPMVPIPFSIPINIFLIFKRLLTKAEVNSFADDDNYWSLRISQRYLTGRLPDWKENQEVSSESIIQGIDTQLAELHEMYQSKSEELKSAIGSQHENVKEIKECLKKTSKQMNEGDAGSEEYIMKVVMEYHANSLKVIEEKVKEVEGTMGSQHEDVKELKNFFKKRLEQINESAAGSERHVMDVVKEHHENSLNLIGENVKEFKLLNTRVEDIEKSLEELKVTSKGTNEEINERIKNVEIQCQEIFFLLKELINFTKEKT